MKEERKHCSPLTCYFGCGQSEQLRQISNMCDEYGFPQSSYYKQRQQKKEKEVPLIELGLGSSYRDNSNSTRKLNGKLSLREHKNWRERSKEKKLSLRKSSSKRNSTVDEQQDQYKNSREAQSVSSEYYHNQTARFASRPIRSTQQTADESLKLIFSGNVSPPMSKFASKENKVVLGTPRKDYTLKLGANLPTLRSEDYNSNGKVSERSEAISIWPV